MNYLNIKTRGKLHKMYDRMYDYGLSTFDIFDAGYFEDDFGTKSDVEKITDISNSNVFGNLPKSIIIAMSGCFSPMHEGHLEAMVLTCEHFYNLGYKDIKGILFPAHDSYVSNKRNGEAKCPIDVRVGQMKEFLFQRCISWIKVDDFPAKELPNEVNFTFLVDRLESYGKHFSSDTAFVVGSDNAKFSYAFSESKTKFICINRERPAVVDRELLELMNVDYTEIDGIKYKNFSSTKIRKGEL